MAKCPIECLYKVANTVIKATLMNLLNCGHTLPSYIILHNRAERDTRVHQNYCCWKKTVYLCVPGWIRITFLMGEAGTNCG